MVTDSTNQTMEETVVAGETVVLTHANVPLDQIELDRDNPRLRYRLLMETNNNGNSSTADLQALILSLGDVKSLMKDIHLNGGLRERVILQQNGNGKLKAVEGNCRLTCYNALHKKDKDDPRWQTIPAKILPKDVNQKHIAIMLADMHVGGKIKWEAHEKAGQVYHMANELQMSQDDIAVYLHTSKSTVSRYLQAYNLMMNTFVAMYPNEGRKKWSHFDEFFKKKELRDELKHNPDFGSAFCEWVGEGRLPQGADVRILPTILRLPDAREAFEEGKPLAEVKKLIENAEPEQGSDFFKLLGKMRESCTSAAQVKEILRIRTDEVARKKLLATYDALVDFMRLADVEPTESKSKAQSR